MTDYDSSNPKHVNIAYKSAKSADRAFDNFLKYAMGVVDGRRFIYSLLVRCYIFPNYTSPFSPDPYTTAFHCGELAVGQQLLAAIMRLCPDDYVKMKREADARDTTDDIRRSGSNADSDGDDSGSNVYIHPAFAGDDSPPAADSEYNPGDEDRDEA